MTRTYVLGLLVLSVLSGCGAREAVRVERGPALVLPSVDVARAEDLPFGGEHVVELRAHHDTTCARTREGHLWCWGSNQLLTMGGETPTVLDTPTRAPVSGVRAFDLRGRLCALEERGLVCLEERHGRIEHDAGASVIAASDDPRVVDATNLTILDREACLSSRKRGVVCFGHGGERVLDEPPEDLFRARGPLADLEERAPDLLRAGVVAGAVGVGHACVARGDGSVACRGYNGAGQLGVGQHPGTVETPTTVAGLASVEEVRVEGSAACARTQAGEVWCWGHTVSGALALGPTGYRASPARVSLPGAATSISLGDTTACAVVAGEVWCWGRKDLWDGGHEVSEAPPSKRPVRRGVSEATKVASGTWHACALGAGGAVTCFHLAQLGAGDTNKWSAPVRVSDLGDATKLVVANAVTCALRRGGRLSCWGYKVKTQYTTRPVDLGVTGVSDFAIYDDDGVCFVGPGGGVTCSEFPDQGGRTRTIGGVTDAVEIDAGRDSLCVRRRTGRVACAQLSALESARVVEVVDVPGLARVTQLSVGPAAACAVEDGRVRCWGRDSGQLGSGVIYASDELIPVGSRARVAAAAAKKAPPAPRP